MYSRLRESHGSLFVTNDMIVVWSDFERVIRFNYFFEIILYLICGVSIVYFGLIGNYDKT